jgi:RNA polymerase sigma factor (sigma-70 family)
MKKPFENIVADHAAAVLRVCRTVVGVHDADDAWSETFISAMRAYPDLPEDANVEAWLVTIAHRKAIDVIRTQNRTAVRSGELPETAAPFGHQRTGDDDLWVSLRSLPDKQRQAVAYHYLGGLPYVEVASILGGTTEAARRAAADGIKSMRRTFTEMKAKGMSK